MYRMVAIGTSVVCFALFWVFLIAPGLYSEVYGNAADRGADFLGRRASAMFLGLAIMLWLTRNVPKGQTRNAICFGTATVFAGIAFTGLFEYLRGNANANILVAAIGEMTITVLLLRAARR